MSSISQIKVKDKTINNPKNVVEAFNNFFVNVGSNTEKNIFQSILKSNQNTI